MARADDGAVAPLLVRPGAARRMLGCSTSHLYGLIATRELDSFKEGRARKITVDSIRDYIRRQLEKPAATSGGVDSAPEH